MKFPQDDIVILFIGMTISGMIFFIYRYYKNRQAVANLSIATGTLDEQLMNLSKDFYEIGREEKSEMIHINSKKASRQHAFINKKIGTFYLTDNNSTNGTFINNQKIHPNEPYPLTNQDEIKIGGVLLKFYDQTKSKKDRI
ncbi:MAG: FHA domain-containing protein [Leptospiraceae bacterium]|nr:FHA domain-containing protein [Leptospiraceae bacterium]